MQFQWAMCTLKSSRALVFEFRTDRLKPVRQQHRADIKKKINKANKKIAHKPVAMKAF